MTASENNIRYAAQNGCEGLF